MRTFFTSLWIHTMNRCTLLPTLSVRTATRAVLACATVWWLTLPALAQQYPVRPFPANALRGTMEITSPPNMVLNGNPARLSPGARIRGVNNMLVMSGALVGQSLEINYTTDPLGLVHEVWVLNPIEARVPRAGAQEQRTNIVSGEPAEKPNSEEFSKMPRFKTK
jgi:hypothetical protein